MKFKSKKSKIGPKIVSLIFGLSVIVLFVGFAVLEPVTSKAQSTDTFIVTQSVTSEAAFCASTSDVTMNGSISGISGGTATGATQFCARTNDSSGYSLTLKATSSPSMQGLTQGGNIPDYVPSVGGTPDYTWASPTNDGYFGYTVSASTTADLDQAFKDNGVDTCGTGSNDTGGSSSCWLDPTTSEDTIMNRTSETGPSGEYGTIYFQTEIDNGAFIVEDTYEATIVLTLTTN